MHDTTNKIENDEQPSVLASLRALLPKRRLNLFEALRIAELQANRLLELSDVRDIPVPIDVVTDLPRIRVDYEVDMPASGASDWDAHGKSWIITLNALEPETRQRLSILHEYKHIIDHGTSAGLVPDRHGRTYYGLSQEEFLAEYFAGCVLMPKRILKRAWGDGIQRIADLAELFDVSERAMQVRLGQVGLLTATDRNERARTPLSKRYVRAPHRAYYRALSANWPISRLPQGVAA
jgi:Zn-dependent peptidase ImmA (M78 family)